MRSLFLLIPLLLAGCATSYQPEGYSGGFSDAMTGPDTAIVSFSGNGYTAENRVLAMLLVRCADLTLQHGYRYFVVTGSQDMGRVSSFTTPGYSTTNLSGSYGYGGFSGNSYTITMPSQTVMSISLPSWMLSRCRTIWQLSRGSVCRYLVASE